MSPIKTTAGKITRVKGPEENILFSKGIKSKFPTDITPMLATLVDAPPQSENWLYEIKWDGYRALGLVNKGKVDLKSRNNKSFNEKFYPITNTLSKWKINVVVDGEIIVPNEETGIANFGDLQNWRSEADGELIFYVFDILWLEGRDLTDLPLMERRKILQTVLPESDGIRISKNFDESAEQFLEAAKKMGLEGVIAKKADSRYHPGIRSKEWLKIKANKRQEMVIGGYTKNDDSSKPFSSLLVGVFEKGKLVYTGKVGTGFNTRIQNELLKKFKPLIVKRSPFNEIPDINKPSRFRPDPPHATATWLKPVLVCEVSYIEFTSDGIMRHPSFEGMRIDKKADQVIFEKEISTGSIVKQTKKLSNSKIFSAPGKSDRKTFLNPKDETQVREVNGHDLKFTNLSKIFWPKEKITKRDVINYYYQVAPYILPYLKDRPQSMNRHPNGITGESFYYKDVTGKAPDWVKTYLYHSDSDDRDRNYLICSNEASLLYMASLGCIEINPWSSKAQKPDHPTWCMIDLDPDKNSFDQVIQTALVTKDVLDSFGIPSYPKTSGSTGMHIYIPLGSKYTYEQSKEFSRVIAKLVHAELPKITSIERIVKNRSGKMYIDFLQNRPQATIAAPYSLRPKPGAPVSMPLHWDEVKKGLKITDHNIFNAVDRIKEMGDIFEPVIKKGINLQQVIKNFPG
jgi:bifunctional non-homologous end joining protein LigD